MIRKTLRIGGGRHTSTTLEPEFWAYLAELAAERGVSPAVLVEQAAATQPAGSSLASTLRTFLLRHARQRQPPLAGELDRVA